MCRFSYATRCVLAVAVLSPLGLSAQGRTPLAQTRTVAQGMDMGALPDSQPVRPITMTLKRTAAQQADLNAYLSSVRTVGSASYHQWLTSAQFAARFAPSADAVTAWLSSQGLQVSSLSASGMRITASGTVAQANAAFAVSLHRLAVAAGEAVSVQGTPSVPVSLDSMVKAVSGLDTSADAVSALEAAVDANASTVLSADLTSSVVAPDELNEVLEQAAAQGQTVVLTHVVNALLPARALVLAHSAAAASTDATAVITPRPEWQVAAGLPADALRATPDAAAVDVNAVVAALKTVALKSGLHGEIASRFYAVASEDGVFTHADTALPAGTWTAADGLGTIDVAKLVKALDVGATPPLNSSIVLSTRNLTHGQSITLTATITGGSGTPTGTVTFATSQDGTIASAPLSAGTVAGTAVATYSTNVLPGGLHGFYGTYNGDSTYAVGTTNVDTATVQPEAAAVTGSVSGSPTVGTTMPVLVTVKSPSGVGTPSGAVMVHAYGTALGQTAFTGTLATTVTGTATATVNIPATNAGSYTFQTNCTANASFSCGQPATFPVTEAKGIPAFALTQTGTTSAATLTATATAPVGAASTVVAPTGTVQFLLGTTVLGSSTVTNGVATFTGTYGSGVLTAVYSGDTNFNTATSNAIDTAKVTATVAATVTPAGTIPYGYDASLNVTVTATTGTTAPAGTVTATVNGATYTGTLSATAGSLSATATVSIPVPPPGTYTITVACGSGITCSTPATAKLTTTMGYTKTTLSVASTAPQAGVGTTLTATVANSGTGSGTYTYSGPVTFYTGNKVLGSATVVSGTSTASVIYTSAVSQPVYAVYSGDTSWNGSTSDPVTVTPLPIQSAIGLSATTVRGIVNQNITLTASVSSGLTGVTLVPSGKVTFYDTYNGMVVNLGSAVLLSNGLSAASATLSTTGLQAGTHTMTAVYAGDSTFTNVTSTATVVNMGDFSLSFTPSKPVITQGATGTVTIVVGSLNGFAGMIALGCTLPPGETLMACSVAPSSVSAGSSAVLTITTTKSTALLKPARASFAFAVVGLGAVCLLGFRRYRVASVLVLLAAAMMMSGGCAQVAGTGNSGDGGAANNGTPLGTFSFTVSGVAVDAPIAARRSNVVQVTVQ